MKEPNLAGRRRQSRAGEFQISRIGVEGDERAFASKTGRNGRGMSAAAKRAIDDRFAGGEI